MSSTSPQQPGKPGTACLGCRRRKLKCSREDEGCSNCSKADLPCVYPAPETGVKRKRGPYKKDKPARERHLEDLVKYLEPKANAQSPTSSATENGGLGSLSSVAASTADHEPSNSVKSSIDAGRKASNSEDLVKDALIALTTAHVSEKELISDNGFSLTNANLPPTTEPGGVGLHPAPRRVFEYWHIYVTRVDPMLKIIHCPTFGKRLFSAVDDLKTADPVTESLLFSIYHSAVSTCSAREARSRFGEDRSVLLNRYGRIIESTLADNYSMPVLESLQALVLYIISIRRDDSLMNVRALFSLAVRMAQLIGLQKDPGDAYPPLEAEMRRRVWWHICGLESRGAEEGGARQSSIIDGTEVRMPSNLNDIDLSDDMKDCPRSRTGVTECAHFQMRTETVRLVHSMMNVKRQYKVSKPNASPEAIKMEQRKIFEEGKQKMNRDYMQYLDPSRPIDWLCIAWFEGMTIKLRLLVDNPFGQVPNKEMPARERFGLLQSSVDIIRLTHAMVNYKAIDQWAWYFRGWVQWHAIAIVIAELGINKNQQFVSNAWKVLDPILIAWDKVYQAKRDEPAWDHVNTLIERARQKRKEMLTQNDTLQAPPQQPTPNPYAVVGELFTASLPEIEQNSWSGFFNTGSAVSAKPSGSELDLVQVQFPTPSYSEMAYMPGNIPDSFPSMPTLENDFGYMEGLDDIDFSAFQGVFGDATWDFSSPPADFYFDQANNL